MTLGEMLRSFRAKQGRSLRDVERLTGISNGYLSQLESNAIKEPSPKHLFRLATAYGVEYGLLMELAGYVADELVRATSPGASQPKFRGLEELNDEDRHKIQAYIDDLRDARRVRGS